MIVLAWLTQRRVVLYSSFLWMYTFVLYFLLVIFLDRFARVLMTLVLVSPGYETFLMPPSCLFIRGYPSVYFTDDRCHS